ncbi:MAG TPA: penicillin acylase family protein [Noviherbaspirillum sp.]|nr:penicillin acylase family protein [Noviherbaspirillum sp.]
MAFQQKLPARIAPAVLAGVQGVAMVIGLSACGGGADLQAGTSTAGTLAFSVMRNAQGIPQIEAPSLAGAAAGLGFSYAQDNFCLLQDYLMTVNGDRSRHLGASASVPSQNARSRTSNLSSDTFYRFYVTDELANALYGNIDKESAQLIEGYVVGVNRYVAETPADKIDQACRGKPWIRAMTPADMHKILIDKAILASGANFLDAIVAAAPPSSVQNARLRRSGTATPSDDDLARISLPEPPLASNAWAVGRDAVEGGGSLLLGNPHFPWTTSSRFYQAKMKVPGVLDVGGAALGGFPIIQIGYNKDFAWTHTVSTGKRFTLYELKLKPGNPTVYEVDGKERAMQAIDVAVPVLDEGVAKTVNRRLYRTDYGPVLVIPSAGLSWTASKAYVLADANIDNNRMVGTWLRLGQAKSVRQAQAILSETIGIPWVNTIASDSAGEVMYADITPVPNVDASDIARCMPSPAAAALAKAGLIVLDGSTKACGWRAEAGTSAPGRIPPGRLPSVIRTDYVANSNDSFWLANPAHTWPEFSPLIGATQTAQRPRTRAALALFDKRLSGNDGLPGKRFTAENLQALMFNNENFMANAVLGDLLPLCQGTPSVTLADGTVVPTVAGCRALTQWDRRSDIHSRGAHLFREFWRTASAIPNVYRVPFDAKDPVNTPRGLNTDDSGVRTALMQSLAKAIRLFDNAGIAADAELGSIQFTSINGSRVPVPGGDEFEGVLNKQEFATYGKDFYQPSYGTSYAQLISLNPHATTARGILAYSQSTDPVSPYFGNQVWAYSEGKLFDLPAPQR